MMQKLMVMLFALMTMLLGHGSATAQAANRVAEPSLLTQAAVPAMVWVTSPWGFTNVYCVHHGINFLRCPGTGYGFRFYWAGY